MFFGAQAFSSAPFAGEAPPPQNSGFAPSAPLENQPPPPPEV